MTVAAGTHVRPNPSLERRPHEAGRLSSNVRHRMDAPNPYGPPKSEVAELVPTKAPARPLGPPPAIPRVAGLLGVVGFVSGIARIYLEHGQGSAALLALTLFACGIAAWLLDAFVRKAISSIPWVFVLLGITAVGGLQYYETSPPGILRFIYVAQGAVFGLAAVLFMFPSSRRWFKKSDA